MKKVTSDPADHGDLVPLEEFPAFQPQRFSNIVDEHMGYTNASR